MESPLSLPVVILAKYTYMPLVRHIVPIISINKAAIVVFGGGILAARGRNWKRTLGYNSFLDVLSRSVDAVTIPLMGILVHNLFDSEETIVGKSNLSSEIKMC